MSHRADTITNVPTNVKIVVTNNDNSAKFKVVTNSHFVEQSSDHGLWDTVSSAFVKPEDTNVREGK
jgi:hypothetical protein